MTRAADHSPRTIATRVAPRALRSIRSGHPWVYDHSIISQRHDPRPGDLAVIFDDRDRFVGIGLTDPGSPIAIRMLHHGRPLTIDDRFFAQRVDHALALREGLLERSDTTGYRLINGENDGLPGLIVDRFADVLVMKIYTLAWQQHLGPVIERLRERCDPAAIVQRASRAVQQRSEDPTMDPKVLFGGVSDDGVRFVENGLVFTADVLRGHKTGHFLDQRDNRQRTRDLAQGVDVLDVFASTGGFTVHAAAGGARSVTSVDISAAALAAAARNLTDNGLTLAGGHAVIVGDAFDVMDELVRSGERFGVIVVDPPSFAPKQADVQRARASYRRLTRAAVELLAPGGTIVQCSCSSRVSEDVFNGDVRAELERSTRTFASIDVTGHPIDHPVTFAEGRYLKAIFAHAS